MEGRGKEGKGNSHKIMAIFYQTPNSESMLMLIQDFCYFAQTPETPS